MVKHTQTIRRQFGDELFECVWLFCEIGTQRVNGQNTKANVPVLLLADNQEKLLNYQWFKYDLWCEYIHCEPKKTVPEIEFTVNF